MVPVAQQSKAKYSGKDGEGGGVIPLLLTNPNFVDKGCMHDWHTISELT